MAINDYLYRLAGDLIIQDDEREQILTVVEDLATRLKAYFGTAVDKYFIFGAGTAGTLLPLKADDQSSVDYMVVFNKAEILSPGDCVAALKKFVEETYSPSEIYETDPQVVICPDKRRIALTPGIRHYQIYQILSLESYWQEWSPIDPIAIDEVFDTLDAEQAHHLKPLIRIMKYWNALNGHILSTPEIQHHCCEFAFPNCTDIREYFYAFWDYSWDHVPELSDALKKSQDVVDKIREHEENGYEELAQEELEKLLPPLSQAVILEHEEEQYGVQSLPVDDD